MSKKHAPGSNLLLEILGWYGAAAIVGAYALVSLSILSPENIMYQLLNLTGAIGIASHAYIKKDYQPVVLNVFWIVIALIAISKTFFI